MEHVLLSASTVLYRRPDDPEIYLVLRARTHRSFPFTHVFPGGKIDEADGEIPVNGVPGDSMCRSVAAAARELFEETGILVTSGSRLDPGTRGKLRRERLAGTLSFQEIIERSGGSVDGQRFIPLGRKTTPPFSRVRFQNQFFLLENPLDQEPTIIPGELEKGQWKRPAEWVEAFESGRTSLAPPVLLLMECWMGTDRDHATTLMRSISDDGCVDHALRIRFSPQIILYPGPTPTLPPATHTNTYIVGDERLLVVDPATSHPESLRQLIQMLDQLLKEGRRVEAIVLTHHHLDHIGGVLEVSKALDAPVWAHRETARLLPEFPIHRMLTDGETVDLGRGGSIQVLHTPGHAPGHLCLHQKSFGGLIVGDMVSTLSTIVIDPPEGRMDQYLESLARLREIQATMLYPSHGSPTPHVRAVIDHLIEHRQHREQKTVEALSPRGNSLDELVIKVYDDVESGAHSIAKRSLLAGLIKLEEEGRARRTKAETWARPPDLKTLTSSESGG